MKTLTEFSIVMLRRGAEARAAKSAEGVLPEAIAEAIAGALSVPAERAQRLVEALDVVGDSLEKVRLVRVYQGEKGPVGATSVGEFHYAIDRVTSGSNQRRPKPAGGDRGGRGGGDRGGGGGPGGGGGFGGGGFGDKKGPPKPRGLSAFMAGADKPKESGDDDRGPRGEMPRAGMGWVLTAAPREARGDRPGGGRGGPRPPRRDDRGPRPGGGPGAPRGPGGGPGGGAGGGGPGGRGPRPAGPGGLAGAGPGGPGGDRRDDRRGPGPGPGGGRDRGPGGGGGGDRGPGGPRPVNQPAVETVSAATEAPAAAISGDETPKS